MFKSLKTPITIGFLFIFFVIFALSSYLLAVQFKQYQLYQKAEQSLPFANQVEQLIRFLAEERGLHGLKFSKYLNKNSKPYLQKQLQTARHHTDNLLYKKHLLREIQSQHPNLQALVQGLKQLSAFRQKPEAFQDYTQLIKQLMDLHQLHLNQALLPLSNITLMLEKENISSLLKLREYSGQERGLMMQVLLSHTLNTENYFKLSGFIQLQEIIINHLKTLNSYVKGDHFYEEVKFDQQILLQLQQSLFSENFSDFLKIRQVIKNQFSLQQQLVEVFFVIGYTGFIHNFKNYVLRHDPIYYQAAKANYQALTHVLKKLSDFSISPQQKVYIQVIEKTFSRYKQNLEKARQLISEDKSIQTIDAQVKVDDLSAQAAIKGLQKFDINISPKTWWQQASQRIHVITQSLQHFDQELAMDIQEYKDQIFKQSLYLILGLLLLGFIMFYIVYYIFQRVRQVVKLSHSLNEMSQKRLFHALTTEGIDEIAQLTLSFNKLIQERAHYEQELWDKSNLDPLTQLPNRSYLLELMDFLIQESQQKNHTLGILFIDLDGFKNINDTKGHHIGDTLLKIVAERLKANIRNTDTAGRLGGDEFIIILPDIKNEENLKMIAKKIIHSLSQPIELTKDFTTSISASIGITRYPQDATNASELLMGADLAMYQAKAKGKNRFELFKKSLASALTFEQQISDALMQAAQDKDFKSHGFFLTYQPIVNTQKDIKHFEALIRWIHPKLGFLAPDQFIQIAENNHTIIPLGEWIIQQAAKQIQQWQLQLDQTLHISINLSSVQSQDGFASVQQILKRLQKQNFPITALHFEITESLLMQNTQAILDGLKIIQSYGCKLYLDDFGTGYSSLSYLKLFPMDVLKIDRSFITDLMEDVQDQELVNAIISIAKVLHMKVIAEGVETQEEFEYLKQQGCDYIQGYWISKPLKAEEATEFFKNAGS